MYWLAQRESSCQLREHPVEFDDLEIEQKDHRTRDHHPEIHQQVGAATYSKSLRHCVRVLRPPYKVRTDRQHGEDCKAHSARGYPLQRHKQRKEHQEADQQKFDDHRESHPIKSSTSMPTEPRTFCPFRRLYSE